MFECWSQEQVLDGWHLKSLAVVTLAKATSLACSCCSRQTSFSTSGCVCSWECVAYLKFCW